MEPTPAECLVLDTLGDVLSWTGISVADGIYIAALLDTPDDEFRAAHPRTIAGIPDSHFAAALASWETEAGVPAGLRLVGAASALMTAARAICRPRPLAPATPPSSSLPDHVTSALLALAAGAAAPKARAARQVKVSTVLDPSDEAEVPTATADQITTWIDNYRAIKHGEPLQDREPTADQIVAISPRVIDLGMEPYADFSVLTPHGRCMAKIQRHRS